MIINYKSQMIDDITKENLRVNLNVTHGIIWCQHCFALSFWKNTTTCPAQCSSIIGAPAPCHWQVIRRDQSESKTQQLTLKLFGGGSGSGRTDGKSWCGEDYEKREACFFCKCWQGAEPYRSDQDRDNDGEVWVGLTLSSVSPPQKKHMTIYL